MSQNLILALIAVLIGSTNPAEAQYQPTESKAEYLPIPGHPLETRYQNCMEDPDCTVQERLMLMGEMDQELTRAMQRMNNTCMDLDYNDCINPRSSYNEEWHKLHSHMGTMMSGMEMNAPDGMGPFMTESEEAPMGMMDEETGEAMSRREPAAGTTEEPEADMENIEPAEKPKEKNWWQRMFGDKEEAPDNEPFLKYE